MFRTAIKNQSALGKKIQAIINGGRLVDDETTSALVKERLAQDDAAQGFILDGFPRTIAQAQMLEQFCALDSVVNFDLSDETVIRRLSGRRLCTACGKSFHIEFMKPRTEGICDDCNGSLITREDDKIEAIKKRLETYRQQTLPLIEFYRKKNMLTSLDAQSSPQVVLQNFIQLFPRACPR